MLIRAASQSDVGQVREQNEDSLLVREDLGLFVVADGMGGHVGGKMASSLAVETIATQLAACVDQLDEPPQTSLDASVVPRLLANAVRAACSTIYERAQAEPALHGMGTTVTALLIHHERAFIAHVGDSRCYVQRGERIMQVTDDHSLVNEQIKAGLLSREQARQSRLKNIITRSVGFERDVAVDTFTLAIRPDDRFLLCSDGLINMVDDQEIGATLAAHSLDTVPQRLVEMANARGGDDNITVVCVQSCAQAAAPSDASPPPATEVKGGQ
ncbi:MAG: Stp1/IreP family PP2C-type Ser/Thr phosphatase [Deltaproteobacteria bacterium]|nr:MAG: Stp1/IreP family PP2C-type Ser/Thr phosphatase [Deltaproteobacteria bacterium]